MLMTLPDIVLQAMIDDIYARLGSDWSVSKVGKVFLEDEEKYRIGCDVRFYTPCVAEDHEDELTVLENEIHRLLGDRYKIYHPRFILDPHTFTPAAFIARIIDKQLHDMEEFY